MASGLEILQPGLGCSIQDAGRFGHRAEGVAVSGALDGIWLACANALAGNAADAAALEVRAPGPRLRVAGGPVRLALVGEVGAELTTGAGERRVLLPWRGITLSVGDVLQVGAPARGVAYLAVGGGVAVAPQLGSRSAYQRACLGGLDGRPLQAGDVLPAGRGGAGAPVSARRPFSHAPGPIRVLTGPQADHFSAEGVRRFFAGPWRVTPEFDRMGLRLEGPMVAHAGPGCADIVSDGVAPGAIQVPASGQPILLLADCQTVGGYPKIATVIRADLPRLAHLRAGDEIRFLEVSRAEAVAALKVQAAELAAWIAGIGAGRDEGWIDEAALYAHNLISGMVAGDP